MNLLYIAPTQYMQQVYDRMVPTQGIQTLVLLTLVLLFALATFSPLDRQRARLLIRAGVQLDATLGRPDFPGGRAVLREFDTMGATLTSPGILALFDALGCLSTSSSSCWYTP